MTFSPFDCMADTVAPYRHPDDGHRRHGERLSIEYGGHNLAAAPFYLLLIVGHALSGRHHVIYDDDFFPFDIPDNLVIPLKDTFFSAFRFMQALPGIADHRIVQS